MFSRRSTVAALAGLAAPRLAAAQPTSSPAWPAERPIEVVVPVPPGGALDALARMLMPHVCARLGEGAKFVVINRPGAGTQIGNEAVFNAAPDGYTLGCITAPALPALPIERPVRYRTADFAWLANVVDDPNTFFVLGPSPLRNLADLVAAARAKPGGLTYGSTGVGGDDHIAMLAFEDWAGTPPMVHVPFAGSVPATQALLGGHIDLLVGNISESLPLQQEGRIRALGVAAPTPVAPRPDVPTFRAQGFDLVAGASRGFVGTPGLPPPIRARLEAGFAAALAESAFLRDAERAGMPLRPLVGAPYAAMIAEMEGGLRRLWGRRPWRE